MSKEYIFWFHAMGKGALVLPWKIPKHLVKVIVSNSNISSDGSLWTNSQNILDIPLSTIVQIKLFISATAPNGSVEIVTQGSKHYFLVPTNPLDPTLLSHSNVAEIMAFISVVEALRANNAPDVDENPYIRQFSKKDKPEYLDNKMDFHWNKNISPWEYYYEFVPESVDKKKHVKARVYEIITLSALSIIVLFALYAIYAQFKW